MLTESRITQNSTQRQAEVFVAVVISRCGHKMNLYYLNIYLWGESAYTGIETHSLLCGRHRHEGGDVTSTQLPQDMTVLRLDF